MKLVRHGARGAEKPGVLDGAGLVRDLSSVVDNINVSDHSLVDRIASLDLTALPEVPAGARLGVPVSHVGKFIGIGLNYSDHALEAGLPIPGEPVIFMKAVSCLSGPNDPIMLPPGSVKTDWEVELGIVIGRRARHVEEFDALTHVAGYCVVNDVSEREYQIERGGTWDKGKGCDSFGPVGPWLVTPDEIADVQALEMWLDVNGTAMQRGSTASMIFSCAQIVAYVSRFVTLEPGDIITTGTPPGVGMGRTPPVFLRVGDTVTLGIAGLGVQRQEVIAHAS
jgi:2-keto-4-pentenoate hydratase/2-oxohepta-3-ene-1,7-dioic acid hydratase in catechol pathway